MTRIASSAALCGRPFRLLTLKIGGRPVGPHVQRVLGAAAPLAVSEQDEKRSARPKDNGRRVTNRRNADTPPAEPSHAQSAAGGRPYIGFSVAARTRYQPAFERGCDAGRPG
ncbi:hypothetical protein DIPPA_17624 [Diplonema papillatum]|nr:hypothetical protein DIPPA_17624 [Diplonema papillatum]